MKEIRKYCVGKNHQKGILIFFLILVLLSLILISAFLYKQNVNISKLLPFLKTILTKGIIIVIPLAAIDIIFSYTVGDLNKRFKKSIKKIKDKGLLDYIEEDFKNGVLFLSNGNVKVGRYFLFLKEEGLIFLFNEISSVRVVVYHVRNSYGNGHDMYAAQFCVNGKYYKIDQLNNDTSDPDWIRFVNTIQSYAPHIVFENTLYETYLYKDYKDYNKNK